MVLCTHTPCNTLLLFRAETICSFAERPKESTVCAPVVNAIMQYRHKGRFLKEASKPLHRLCICAALYSKSPANVISQKSLYHQLIMSETQTDHMSHIDLDTLYE